MTMLTRCTLALSLFAGLSSAEVRLPAVLGDHMVLQREDVVRIWGWADPGEEVGVSASWQDRVLRTVAAGDGSWSVELATGAAGGPYTLTIRGENELVLDDVLLGEVWVCGGQSNMEWSLDACAPLYRDVAAAADYPTIRLFDVARHISPTPEEDCRGEWRPCTPRTVGGFSAIGFFFGRELATELDVPIGLVGSNWGGTLAEAWTSADTLRDWPDFAEGLAVVDERAADPEGGRQSQAERLAAWWLELEQRDVGSREGWQQPELDDSAWRVMEVPNNWSDTPLAGFDGLVWMRRHFEAPAAWDGKACLLDLGPIDDMDTTWVNGVRVGGLQDKGLWTTERRYEVPAGVVHAGENVIAVRVYDSGGAGGLFGKAEAITIAPLDASRALGLAGSWRYRTSTPQKGLARWPADPALNQHYPGVLYNGMIAPLTNLAIRGAIWYQGESNRTRAEQYRSLFPALIADWRAHWGRGAFPFYFVQIAPFGYGGDTGQAAALRDAQRETLRVPGTGMAVTMDIGNPANIHPKNKLDVGHRLALWALAKTYGRDLAVWSGPLYRSMELVDAGVVLRFEQVGGGLRARGGGALTHFQLAGNDRVFHPAQATIAGDTLVVTSAEVPLPVAVRYAWGAADVPNLENTAGLPASSFRSDRW